jgi:DNA-binding response OmpR family regulator
LTSKERQEKILTGSFTKRNDKKTERTKGIMYSNRERKRILLVEDHEDAREIAAFSLGEYTLIYAHNFDDGLRFARRGYFDLYILDNWLPDGSGAELCRLIREFDPHTPILFYSACAYARDLQAAFNAGAQAYLVKPISSDDITQAVARLTSVPPETAFEARRAESAAILEELAIRQAENAERVEKAKEKSLRAKEKALRLKAEMAFLAAGGARGDFAREWPSVFLGEVRGARASATCSGD